jgi:hypothetical protein
MPASCSSSLNDRVPTFSDMPNCLTYSDEEKNK